MKIGFFDSGIGGLTVLHRAIEALPDEKFIFYADEDNVPYGEKSRAEILSFSDNATSFLIENGAKIIVIACNTATSAAVAHLRGKYNIPFIGMEPAVKPAIACADGKRVLVTATPFTIREEKLKKLIDAYDTDKIVDLLPLPKLVGLAEGLEFRTPAVQEYIQDQFAQFDMSQYGQVVLGCTHFNYFKDSFKEILQQEISLIDGVGGTVRHLVRVMQENGLFEPTRGEVEYYISGREVTDRAELNRFEILHRRLAEMEKI